MHLHIKLALLMQREKIGLKIARLCLALPVMSCSELLWYFLLIYLFFIFFNIAYWDSLMMAMIE